MLIVPTRSIENTLIDSFYDFQNIKGAAFINGFIFEEEGRLILEKRSGFSLSGKTKPTFDTGDFVVGGGDSNKLAVYDASAGHVRAYVLGTDIGSIGPINLGSYQKAWFGSLDSYGIAINSNQAYTRTSGSYAQITDADFPTNLAWGGAVINGRLFVGDYINGRIYQSDEGDPTSYDALGFISTNNTSDDLVAITQHEGGIAVFKSSSIQFYYHNNSPSGSVLRRREDILHRIGTLWPNTISKIGDSVVFVGGSNVENSGANLNPGVYILEKFSIRKISTPGIDAILRDDSPVTWYGEAVSNRACGRNIFVLTYNINGSAGTASLVYDLDFGTWCFWTFQSGTSLPVVAVVDDEIVLYNGTMLRGTQAVLHRDISTAYLFGFRSISSTYGSTKRKIFNKASVVGGFLSSGDWSIRYTDDDYVSYSSSRTVPATFQGRISNLGSSHRRAFELTYTGDLPAKIEGLEIEVGVSGQ